jgi:hypothetical protein
MDDPKAARLARCADSGEPRKFAHTGKRRNLRATIPGPRNQPHSALDLTFVLLGDAARILRRLAEERA